MSETTVVANPGSGGSSFVVKSVTAGVIPKSTIVWGDDSTANNVDTATGKPLPVQVRSTTGLIPIGEPTDAKSTATDTTSASLVSILKQVSASVQGAARMFAVAASAMTRPANQTGYTADDAVSNNATAGSVTAISFTLSDTNDDPVALKRMRLASTDTGVAAKNFRAWLYQSDPTASSGIVGGDNAAFSTKQGAFIGSMVGQFRAFSDGSVAVLTPDENDEIITRPTSGAKTIFALLQTLDAFTPSANSTTFTATLEGRQGRA